MQIKKISITDHALIRWRERINTLATVEDIKEVIKKASIIKKNESIPVLITRCEKTVYALHDEIIFVLEPLQKNEYKLITVIDSNSSYKHFRSKPNQHKKNSKRPNKSKEFKEDTENCEDSEKTRKKISHSKHQKFDSLYEKNGYEKYNKF